MVSFRIHIPVAAKLELTNETRIPTTQSLTPHTELSLKQSPTSYLPIIPSSCHNLPVRAVAQHVHVVEVSLLLEDVGLGLPLPHQKLPQTATAEGKPLPRAVHCHAGDTLLGNAANRELTSKD